jgi:hypothetical protein
VEVTKAGCSVLTHAVELSRDPGKPGGRRVRRAAQRADRRKAVPRYKEFGDTLLDHKPDVVFTHWPIDTHPDHRAASLFTYDAWLRAGKKFPLYFYEVETGQQTQDFWPTRYVDVTEVAERKKAASYANTLTVDGWWPLHDQMQRSRGSEKGCKFAEAFNRHPQSPDEPALALP